MVVVCGNCDHTQRQHQTTWRPGVPHPNVRCLEPGCKCRNWVPTVR